jgi:Mn-dependent DtxR family transcriptional regulator
MTDDQKHKITKKVFHSLMGELKASDFAVYFYIVETYEKTKGKLKHKDISEATNIHRNTVRSCLKRLAKIGLVVINNSERSSKRTFELEIFGKNVTTKCTNFVTTFYITIDNISNTLKSNINNKYNNISEVTKMYLFKFIEKLKKTKYFTQISKKDPKQRVFKTEYSRSIKKKITKIEALNIERIRKTIPEKEIGKFLRWWIKEKSRIFNKGFSYGMFGYPAVLKSYDDKYHPNKKAQKKYKKNLKEEESDYNKMMQKWIKERINKKLSEDDSEIMKEMEAEGFIKISGTKITLTEKGSKDYD